MNDEREVKVITWEGKEYFLLSMIEHYQYYAELNNPKNFIILKSVAAPDGLYLQELSEEEYDDALLKYGKKHIN